MSTETVQQAPTRDGNYVDIDGVNSYYEVTGAGEPLVLLHGGLCTAETWDPQVAALAERYQVYVPERCGHGRTRDVDGPITYENMAQHTIGFMEALGIESAHLAGWSDGALVGVLVALRRPKLVRKLVFIDQYVTLGAAPTGLLPFLAQMSADSAPPFLVELYKAASPDGPDHFAVVCDKMRTMWLDETGVELTDLEHVTAPTLILGGDDGGLTLEHVAAMRAALPDSQLAIVPGTDHGLAMEKPHVVNQLILDFLADEQAPKLFSFDEE